MKGHYLTILSIFLVFVLFLAGCTNQVQTPGQKTVVGTGGRVLFTIADKSADLGSVSSIQVTVDSVSAQTSSGSWVTISSTPRTYDLLALRGCGT